MEIRILGPLEVSVGGSDVVLARPKQRALLACLLLRANQVVSTDELVQALWGERPPDTANTALQGHVSALRKLLGAEAIATRRPGYVLELAPEETDLGRFEALLGVARGADDPGFRAQTLRDALALFRGEPLADFRYEEFAGDEARRLDEVRLAVLEDRIEADLEVGLHNDVVPELERLVAVHPLHERLREQLMLALYRSGRQADALQVYQSGRRHLDEHLGIEPGPAVRELERRILNQDPALTPVSAPSPGSAPPRPREERKRVTLLLCDVLDARARPQPLDPEDADELMQRCAGRVRAELEGRGGTVQHAVGQNVMAAFGAPAAHEDDPERAVRAALAVRDAVAEFDDGGAAFTVRVAVHTGEALVALDGADQRPAVVGEVVNAVSRLLQTAADGEILVGDSTQRATRRAIDFARARGDPPVAWEAVAASTPVGAERPLDAPLVGRARELELLVDVLARVRAERRPQRITVVGVPGIGKSRLVREVSRRAEDGQHVWRQGRSLPYGDGVTFWALGEIVKAEAGIAATDAASTAEEKLERAVARVLSEPGEARWVTSHLRPLVGLTGGAAPGGQAFTAWRLFLEGLAAHTPLTLVFEDLHWADEGLLDFVDELLDRATGVPLVVLATARPELLERRPGWATATTQTAMLSLSPLSAADMAGLVAALLPEDGAAEGVAGEVIDRAAGNPLYAEEYARLLTDRGAQSGLETPATLHGLIAARLDALPPAEKGLVQDAAVIGEVAWLDAIATVADRPAAAIDPLLRALERKEFVRRVRRSTVEGQTEYAFHHVLIRDVAYGAIPRARRSEKHALAAGWIESLGRSQDHAEMLAHHSMRALELAQAAGLPTEAQSARARGALEAAGDRASSLGAFATADSFYTSALSLWPTDDPARLALQLAAAQSGTNAGTAGATERIAVARDALMAAGDLEGAAEAEVSLEEDLWDSGERDRACCTCAVRSSSSRAARERGAGRGAQPARVAARADGDPDGLAYGERALALARELQVPALEARALRCTANARLAVGDLDGALRDCQLSLELDPESPSAVGVYGNVAVHHLSVGDLTRSMTFIDRALELGQRVGTANHVRWLGEERALRRYITGAWPDARQDLDAYIADAAIKSSFMEALCRSVRALLRLADADIPAALDDSAAAVDLAREVRDPIIIHPALAIRARCLHEATRPGEADSVVEELLGGLADRPYVGEAWLLPQLGLVAGKRADDVAELISRYADRTRWAEPAVLLARGEFGAAADLLAGMGARADEAFARLLAAERLTAAGLTARAEPQRARAEAFYRAVEAPGYLARAMSLA